MKYIIYIFIGIILSNCKSQNIFKNNIPKIDNKTEKIDFTIFSKKNKMIIRVNEQNKSIDTIYINSNTHSYSETDINHKQLVYYSGSLKSDGLLENIYGKDYSVNPIFEIHKIFHNNGNIKIKGIYCWFGFQIGKWYHFNEKGNIIKTVNYDEGFNFGYEKLFKFCKKNNISLTKKTSGYRTQIWKQKTFNNKYIWHIQYPSLEKPVYINIQLDGINGNILETKETDLPIFEHLDDDE